MLTLASVAGQNITTIEGLDSRVGQAVKKAWLGLSVPQCGFCQSGQVMAATALLAKTKNPSDSDIDSAMSGIICRCGTYSDIRRAIHSAAKDLA
jgi:isoquinoline 1-oxidoreductase alpha subunit